MRRYARIALRATTVTALFSTRVDRTLDRTYNQAIDDLRSQFKRHRADRSPAKVRAYHKNEGGHPSMSWNLTATVKARQAPPQVLARLRAEKQHDSEKDPHKELETDINVSRSSGRNAPAIDEARRYSSDADVGGALREVRRCRSEFCRADDASWGLVRTRNAHGVWGIDARTSDKRSLAYCLSLVRLHQQLHSEAAVSGDVILSSLQAILDGLSTLVTGLMVGGDDNTEEAVFYEVHQLCLNSVEAVIKSDGAVLRQSVILLYIVSHPALVADCAEGDAVLPFLDRAAAHATSEATLTLSEANLLAVAARESSRRFDVPFHLRCRIATALTLCLEASTQKPPKSLRTSFTILSGSANTLALLTSEEWSHSTTMLSKLVKTGCFVLEQSPKAFLDEKVGWRWASAVAEAFMEAEPSTEVCLRLAPGLSRLCDTKLYQRKRPEEEPEIPSGQPQSNLIRLCCKLVTLIRDSPSYEANSSSYNAAVGALRYAIETVATTSTAFTTSSSSKQLLHKSWHTSRLEALSIAIEASTLISGSGGLRPSTWRSLSTAVVSANENSRSLADVDKRLQRSAEVMLASRCLLRTSSNNRNTAVPMAQTQGLASALTKVIE